MKTLAKASNGSFMPQRRTVSIQTTLYELIEAVSEEVPEREEFLIAQTVYHMMKSNQLKWMDIRNTESF